MRAVITRLENRGYSIIRINKVTIGVRIKLNVAYRVRAYGNMQSAYRVKSYTYPIHGISAYRTW